MQILLHSDPHTDGSAPMAEHLNGVLKAALARFGERITRVEAHLSDVNSLARHGENDIHCTLEARLVGLDAVVVKDQAGNAHQAIDGAARKLKRAVGSVLARHDPRGRQAASAAEALAAGSSADAEGEAASAGSAVASRP